MKKTICLLCLAALIFATAGCGGEEASAPDSTPGGLESGPDVSQAPEESSPPVSEAEPPEPEPTRFADYSWSFDTPENHGMDPGMLENFHSALDNTGVLCALTVKDGVIIDEYYKEGENENSVFRFNSCTKSVSGALIGLAIDQGLLSGVDAKLTEFFPQLNEPGQEDKSGITVGHLLTHTSGIYWSEWSGGDYFHRLSDSDNWVEFVLGQDMASAPGEVFNYTTGGSHLLGAVIEEAVGMTAFEFGLEYLFKPLGMRSVEWRHDPQGVTDGGNGLSMTARDAAKLGQLYLNGGSWEGEEIIPEEWVSLSVERQAAGSPGTGEYGYSWWLKPFGSAAKWYSSYYAMGAGGQYIIVVPELELVTVMSSRQTDTYLPQYYFNDYVIAAVTE